MKGPLEGDAAFGALVMLDFLADLFTGASRETYSREQVLVILNALRHEPELFSEETLSVFGRATEDIE